MRPVLALLLSLTIFGAVGGYLQFLREVRIALAKQEQQADREVAAKDQFSLEVTLTFDAGGGSAFSVEPAQAPALRVLLRGREVLRIDEPLAAGTPVRVEKIEGVVEGANEFFVEAHPASQEAPIAHALRVQVLRNGHPVAEETLWSAPGLPVRGTVRIEVEPAAALEHGHVDTSSNLDSDG